jgi:hypothetical protein
MCETKEMSREGQETQVERGVIFGNFRVSPTRKCAVLGSSHNLYDLSCDDLTNLRITCDPTHTEDGRL